MCVQSQQNARALLSSILPKGKGTVLILKFYADESIDRQGSFMNVSGFLMTEGGFAFLDEAVTAIRGDLPYFHMCEGHHKSHPGIYSQLCKLICSDFIMAGISASLEPKAHKVITDYRVNGQALRYWTGTTYTYLLNLAMMTCSDWLNGRGSSDYIAYVFEAGHQNAGDASFFFDQLPKRQFAATRDFYRYASHTFVDGKGPLGSVLQLADIFAWHMNREALGLCTLEEIGKMFRVPIATKEHTAEEVIRSMGKAVDAWQERQRK